MPDADILHDAVQVADRFEVLSSYGPCMELLRDLQDSIDNRVSDCCTSCAGHKQLKRQKHVVKTMSLG